MGYAVYHTEKGKSSGSAIGYHIDRIESKVHTFKHADPSRRQLNREYADEKFSKLPLSKAIALRMSEGYTAEKTIRKDAVRYLKHVLTGSHEDMLKIAANSASLDAWVEANRKFIAEEFGEENMVRFTLHMDETTPHIHAVTVPLLEGKLTAKEMVGNAAKMKKRQDKYGIIMNAFGLKRGLENTGIRHETAKEYYARINETDKESERTETEIEKIFDEIFISPFSVKSDKERLKAKISTFVKNESRSTGVALIRQNRALKDEFKAKEVKADYACLVAAAKKIKEDISVGDYFSAMVFIEKLRFDGRHGNELYYALPTQKTGSIAVNPKENIWFDHAAGTGGDLISAVKQFEGLGFTDAVLRLSNDTKLQTGISAMQSQISDRTSMDDEKAPIQVTAELEIIQHPALIEYLQSRKLTPADGKGMAKEVHWTRGAQRYFAVGFPDGRGNYAVRFKHFKGNIGGMGVQPLQLKGGMMDRGILIFEGAFDLIAYRKLHPAHGFIGIILHGVAKLAALINGIKQAGKYAMSAITLMLDNDKAGDEATAKAMREYPGIKDGRDEYPNYKDLAEKWENQNNQNRITPLALNLRNNTEEEEKQHELKR